MKFGDADYDSTAFYDELVDEHGRARPHAAELIDYFATMAPTELLERQRAANRTILDLGISFTIYSEGDNIDRAWPLDIIPRAMPAAEWDRIEAGLMQRVHALNLFIDDLYNDRRILKDKVVPEEIIDSSRNYLEPCRGFSPKHGVWAHVCGTDLVRGDDGTVYVLEDNLRVPSGVSYMLENRNVIKRVFPSLFGTQRIRPVSEYPTQLSDMLESIAPGEASTDDPEIAVLTPGIYNSAYFEHSYLARTMGAELVEGGDLVVEDRRVFLKTIAGLKPVDTIYRRIDDVFLDPDVFRPDSMLGVPGIVDAWRAGNVALANAPGSGVADDKVVYSYVPDIIRYYLDEDAIIPNVPTWRCSDPKQLEHVLARLPELVVKPANESGGYGMLVGPHATRGEHEQFRRLLKADPRNYIAQPTLKLSTAPTLCGDTLEPRHLDLRPFILSGASQTVTAGGLTRVAMRKGSLVVNSSQGGGSKDTWIIEEVS